jgi:segregation and condensation protein A
VDLSRLSILDLAGQFAAALDAAVARRQVPLSRLADWLVMAAHLALLRSRLLLPADSAEAVEARREAEAVRRRLADRGFVRRLADWLEQRPRLGRDVFARGAAEEEPESADQRGAATPAADVTALLRACLAVLERPGRGGSWRPAPLPLWRVPDALARLRRILPTLPEGAPLERFLPEPVDDGPDAAFRRRAALASTLLAGLELGREGVASLSQEGAFGAIVVAPAMPRASAHGGTRAKQADRAGRHSAHRVEA